MRYIHLTAGSALPSLDLGEPFKSVVVLEQDVAEDDRALICDALVAAGSLYVMAWGKDCTHWPDELRAANLAAFSATETEEVPDASLVIATAHPTENLTDLFWFARYTAMHPCHQLDEVVLIHVGPEDREREYTAAFESA